MVEVWVYKELPVDDLKNPVYIAKFIYRVSENEGGGHMGRQKNPQELGYFVAYMVFFYRNETKAGKRDFRIYFQPRPEDTPECVKINNYKFAHFITTFNDEEKHEFISSFGKVFTEQTETC